METDKNILNKTPEQIFNELTANIDSNIRHVFFQEVYLYMFSTGNSPWNIMRFLYTIVAVYYPSQCQFLNINAHLDILGMGRELYNITPNSPEYKNIPKYLHGVVNKRENTFMHPYDRCYIVKPVRGQTKQYMDQCMKTYDALLHFEKMQSLYKISDNDNRLLVFLSELYNEVLKLVSMTTVCTAPKYKDIMNSGSMHLLNEYNQAASFGVVAHAMRARRKIISDTKSGIEKQCNLFNELNNQERQRLAHQHDTEIKTITDFTEFQVVLRRHEQELFDLIKNQRTRIQVLKQTAINADKEAERQRKYELLNAQLKMSRITRMR